MIVEQFIHWVTTASADKRAKATHALARAYLASDFSEDDHSAAEAAMTFLLDDPEPVVRKALLDVLVASDEAPRHIILGLLDDLPEIGEVVAALSPLLIDSELVDIIAIRDEAFQLAVATRIPLCATVSAAIVEVTPYKVCCHLIENPEASILPSTLFRLAERFGKDPHMQQLLLAHESLPIAARQLIVANLSDVLCEQAVNQSRMDAEQAKDVAREARDRATLALVRQDARELPALITHLRDTSQLTTVLLLRAICAGQVTFFVEALARLSSVSAPRINALLSDNSTKALRTLYSKAGLPEEAYPAFSIAFGVYASEGTVVEPAEQYRFTRIMIERILERYHDVGFEEVDELMAMLRRFASETARDAARDYVNNQIKVA